MTFKFNAIIIVEQIVDKYNTNSTYHLKLNYTNHVEQLESFNIPDECFEEHIVKGVSQYNTTNKHGEEVVYTLIRSIE